MHILTSYLDQYQHDLRRAFYRRSTKDNMILFTQRYRDHVREANLRLHFITSYKLPQTSPLRAQWTKQALFYFLLAFEDIKGLDFLTELHPRKRSFIEREAAHHFSGLRTLEDALQLSSLSPAFSPPPRSA